MKYSFIALLSLLALASGCYREDGIRIPDDRSESGYSVPQGDNPFDSRIVEWNGKMDSKLFILYKFTPRDVYWNNTRWDGILDDGSFPEGFNSAYKITQAAEEHVDEQLSFIEDYFLSLYPADFLKGRLPQKILLAGTIEKHERYSEDYPVNITDQDTYTGFDNLTVRGGDGQIGQMTPEEKVIFAKNINTTFFNYLADKELIEVPDEFTELADGYPQLPLGEIYFYHGFLDRTPSGSVGQKAAHDFITYLSAALETDEVLNMVNDFPAQINMPQFEGILYYDPDRTITVPNMWGPDIVYTGIGKDKSGKIKQKYDIVIRYMLDKYGIDFKAVSQVINTIQ